MDIIERDENTYEIATFGGGCFWCLDALFRVLAGVLSVESGYAGGHTSDPDYRKVSMGITGHAEVIQVKFFPDIISFADLIRLFMAVHNPTLLNRQGGDKGTQYRSILFYHDNEQQEVISLVLKELKPYFDKPILTEIKEFQVFYKAEEHHQEYYHKDPEKAYCKTVIRPKLNLLKEHFSDLLIQDSHNQSN
ncbi:MAG TPA: peptide-methionine (S)-S-oxide reductase MsrA [Flavisolibacter sp.]|nr:peptide-methionine (S)-S-oxide reductase MsrA [Flavisolibacter sp.]